MLHKAQVSSWRLRLHLLAQIDRSQVYTSSLRSIWSAGLDFKLLMAIPVKFLLLAQTITSQSELIILFSQCSSAVHGTDAPWAWKAKLQSSFTISLPSSSVSIRWIPKSSSYDHILNPGPQCIFLFTFLLVLVSGHFQDKSSCVLLPDKISHTNGIIYIIPLVQTRVFK